MTINNSVQLNNPVPGDPGLPPNSEIVANPAIPVRRAAPPGTELLSRLEDIAFNLPPITQNVKAMSWLIAIPLALGGLNCANENYLASVPCFIAGTLVLGTALFRTVFYPPAMISPQLLNPLFLNRT